MFDTQFALMDYHLHTSRCHHAAGSMDEYLTAAAGLGISTVGFADHAPNTHGFDPAHRMTWHEFEGYTAEIDSLRNRFPELEIFTGIEADIYPGFETDLSALKNRFPIDYVIGSVHYIYESLIFDFHHDKNDPHSLHDYLAEYFNTLEQGIDSGLIDIIGHLDVIKYIYNGVMTSEIKKAMALFIPILAERKMTVELNTSGFRKLPGQSFPDQAFLPVMAEYGIPACLGSDAHTPEHVGHHFDSVCTHLHRAGFQSQVRSSCGLLMFSAQP